MADQESYWYRTVYELCPVCGMERSYKYRVYGEKPKDVGDRVSHVYINHYCDT
ncbi:MAG: hypothetical protein KAS32_04025 [Candidatus Peribacteraceae bacterium]|nr:hypothetical protein [Candidatus Peribacteraceae bacterium]